MIFVRSKCLAPKAVGKVMSHKAIFAAVFLALSLSACTALPGFEPGTTETVQEPADPKYFPSDEPYHLGVEQFNRGHYGLAERYFRDAVEKAPEDAASWMGLAASYDRIGRFDLADRAYQKATQLTGETVQLLNNRGYSSMLRGDLPSARKMFEKAAQIEPGNPTIANNLALLDGSSRYIKRE